MRLDQLQVEVKEWSNRNFPANKPHHPLLGLTEEVGELSHAHLKMEQGIRGTMAEHMTSKRDAVGDIIIYLCDYCARNDISLELSVEEAWETVKKRDWTKNKSDGKVSENCLICNKPIESAFVMFKNQPVCIMCAGELEINLQNKRWMTSSITLVKPTVSEVVTELNRTFNEGVKKGQDFWKNKTGETD